MTNLDKYLTSFEHRGVPPNPEDIACLLEIIRVQKTIMVGIRHCPECYTCQNAARAAIAKCEEIAKVEK